MPKIVLILARLRKNFRSNRLWEISGGRVYIRVPNRWQPFLGLGLSNKSVQALHFYLLWNRFFFRAKKRKLSVAIVNRQLGMFGNMTRRLAKSISLCIENDFDGVFIPQQAIFSRQWYAEGTSAITPKSTLWFGSNEDFSKANIEVLAISDFFYTPGGDDLFSPRTASVTWSHLASRLKPETPMTELGKDVLTLHVRGGDVFGSRQPASYGQPPLAFYLLVLTLKDWKKVVLVYQDTSNPVVEGIVEYCTSNKMLLDTQSSTDTRDVSLLLSATNLAGGRGTFIPAIVGLSQHLQNVYFFEDKFSVLPRKEGVMIHRVIDVEGVYRREVLGGKWINSNTQRELMMSYPTRYLKVSKNRLGEAG